MPQRIVRIALQAVIFFLLLGVVMAVASPTTGVAEKGVVIVVGLGLIALAARLRRTGPDDRRLRGV